MNLEGMANTIDEAIDFYAWDDNDAIKNTKAAKRVMFELVGVLKEQGIETVSELRDMFKELSIIAKKVDEILEKVEKLV